MYCNTQLYCGRAWLGIESQYNVLYCDRRVWLLGRIVSQYTMCIVTGKGQEAWQPVSRHGHFTAVPARAHAQDKAPCAHDTADLGHDMAGPRPATRRDTAGHCGHNTAMRAPVHTWVCWLGQQAVHLVHPTYF